MFNILTIGYNLQGGVITNLEVAVNEDKLSKELEFKQKCVNVELFKPGDKCTIITWVNDDDDDSIKESGDLALAVSKVPEHMLEGEFTGGGGLFISAPTPILS